MKFGTLVYYTNNGDVVKLLKKAYKEAGGLGDTELKIYEFKVPSPSTKYKIK